MMKENKCCIIGNRFIQKAAIMVKIKMEINKLMQR